MKKVVLSLVTMLIVIVVSIITVSVLYNNEERTGNIDEPSIHHVVYCEPQDTQLTSISTSSYVVEEYEEPIEETVSETLDTYDMLTLSNLTPEELSSGLLYELKDLAQYFIEAEKLYGVNALYLASISALESGWGRYQFKDNNIFGFGSKSFESEVECIDYVASFLSSNYLDESGKYYSGGSTLYHVNLHYNGSDFWYDNVTMIADNIRDRISTEMVFTECPS